MVKRGAKKEGTVESSEMEERKRLKKLALENNLLSETPATGSHSLSPSKTVIKHHGKDIIRKSQRSGKSRYLFSFPGLLAPISGGKIGELKDLGTKNPILYLDFPQGQMKLFGTIVYPKNRYLTLQFSKSGKNVTCEDNFDNMILFSEAWWIGRKDENPEETRLEFPKEMNFEPQVEYDFKGGAGGSERKTNDLKAAKRPLPESSPVNELEDDSTDSENKPNEVVEVTPSRRSTRTAGRMKRYADESSGDDVVENGAEGDIGDNEEEILGEEEVSVVDIHRGDSLNNTEKSYCKALNLDKEDTETSAPIPKKRKQSAKSAPKSQDLGHSTQSTMVQATISTLFKKVEEKSSQPKLKGKAAGKRKDGTKSAVGKKKTKVEIEDDDIASSSPDINTSDEEWGA
ncbi:OLC1v1013930C2 [Oldenlandia corymbosa var. corymbosa]|uniref:OLC1v1013930C2 n=2 Tax=Oldenlandia corymbosa var. corymbosa TaxID=529605 RepID=A0AAV1E0C4_OLDCO|nr:OLC1v1013930C2 [Oldenlandia corymbosa var. corymbosa]